MPGFCRGASRSVAHSRQSGCNADRGAITLTADQVLFIGLALAVCEGCTTAACCSSCGERECSLSIHEFPYTNLQSVSSAYES